MIQIIKHAVEKYIERNKFKWTPKEAKKELKAKFKDMLNNRMCDWREIRVKYTYNLKQKISDWKECIVFIAIEWWYRIITYTIYSVDGYNKWKQEKERIRKKRKKRKDYEIYK